MQFPFKLNILFKKQYINLLGPNTLRICKKCEDCFVLVYTYSGVVRDEDLNSSYGTLDLGESFQSESESVYVCTVCMYMYMRVCMH